MELRQLRYFVAVAEELHFTRAAARLNVAQPPLSQQIRQLEGELQTALLRRNSRHVELTAAGQAFLEEARRTLAQADRAVHAARVAGRGPAGHLDLGFVDSSLHGYLPEVLRDYRRRYPDVQVALRELTSGAQAEAIQRGDLQVGLLRPTQAGPLLELEELGRERLVVALPADHELRGHRSIPLVALEGQPFVLFPRALAPELHDHITSLCQQAGFAPTIAEEAGEGHTIIGLVAAGLGISLVPETLSRWGRHHVAYRPLVEPRASVAMCLGWRRGDHAAVVESFLEVARTARAQGRLPGRPRRPANSVGVRFKGARAGRTR